jgi:hypothetical protein
VAFTSLVFGTGFSGSSALALPLVFGAIPQPVEDRDATLTVTLRLRAAIGVDWPDLVVPTVLCGAPARLPWRDAGAAPGAPRRLPWQTTGRVHAAPIELPSGDYLPLTARQVRLPWETAPTQQSTPTRLPWGTAHAVRDAVRLPWQTAHAVRDAARLPWQTAHAVRGARRLPWGVPQRRADQFELPWDRGRLIVAPGAPWNVQPPHIGNVTAPGRIRLVFCHPLPTTNSLVFGPRPCPPRGARGVAIASRSTYMHTHSLAAFRLPDLTPVPLTAVQFTAGEDAYGWTLNASGPVDALTLLAPVGGLPAQLRVTLDGMTWEFVVEGLRRDRSFGSTRATITGRSLSATLGDPYRAQRTWLSSEAMTAQQIVEAALVFTGLGLTWSVTDWLVPAGIWSHTGTPLSVVRTVAEAIGAIVQSPRAGASIAVVPRYPLLPWAWGAASADVTLALDPIDLEGYERVDRPAFEGVYVSGQAQGVLALVKRTGTAPAADLLLPMVTDPLITHLDAARQRGEALLGAAGPQARMTLSLPVLTGVGEPGVIDPGELVLVNDPDGAWRGLVRSVNVTGSHLTVRQTIVVERHL